MLIDYRDALRLVAEQSFTRNEELVPLPAAAGRVLSQPVRADRPQPPFNRVAMDGIAINYAAYAAGQRDFPIARLQAAGQPPLPLTNPKQCVEIMTGAALPGGCTTVIRYEDLERRGDAFRLPEGVEDGKSIHFAGADVAEGDLLLPAGSTVDVAATGMLATCGYAEVPVVQLPRTAVISTGNELVPVDATPAPHQIRRSNVFQLVQLLRTAGIEAEHLHLEDDREALHRVLGEILAGYELVILSGGVSKGKLDFVPEILSALGVRTLFHGVAQRPGKPIWVGRTDTTMVFGLPGNPVSSVACCQVYVGEHLRHRLGLPPRQYQYVELATDIPFKPDLTHFDRVLIRQQPEAGTLLAHSVKNAGSGDAASLLRANGLVILPRGKDLFRAGEVYPCIPLNRLL
ncbi:molybdopterin molybdotransferase MoeA [Lewinella sp. W8]|uniref:molybdopterin molybdotransferase MoeA n=1 Tax=Lewinella sp. W8 TaxID=2528208 RepID=UPI0015651AD3|nr:molybdopterin molybdotransferase MoeA [Lewinella sp. W8]